MRLLELSLRGRYRLPISPTSAAMAGASFTATLAKRELLTGGEFSFRESLVTTIFLDPEYARRIKVTVYSSLG